MKTQFETVDLTGLTEEISSYLGFPIKLEQSLGLDREGNFKRLHLKSQELKQLSGITSCLYESLFLDDFAFSYDTKGFWIEIDFRFTYKSGGSNGTKLCDAWYNFEDKSWKAEFK